MRAVLKDARMREQAGAIRRELAELCRDVERMGQRVENLDRHFGLAARDIAEIRVSADKAGRRALRLDKMTIAALEATLRLYLDPDRLRQRLPALRLLSRPRDEIRACALRLQPAFAAALGARATVEVVDCSSQIGSGSLPVDRLPSAALSIRMAGRGGGSLDRLASRLRTLPRPVVGRIHDNALLLDLRCLEADGEAVLVAQLPQLAG
jgi:L-seryl-tRNA(Ser) seleniumtransferase